MKKLLERIQGGETIVSDGAIGTVLFEKGLKPGNCPEEINLSNPDMIKEVVAAYIDAGADIVQTNTFGGSPAKLAEFGLDSRAVEINRKAAELARLTAPENVVVSGSCGPSGKMLEPYGDGVPADLQKGFEKQVDALISGGVDIICVETMTDINEAVLAVSAVRNISKTIPVMATMTFDKTPNGFFTMMGIDIAAAIKGLESAGADVVGSNCGNGLDKMIEIAREFREKTGLPVIIQSNAGQPEATEGHLVYKETPQYFADRIDQLIDLGINVIGGCCGTTPGHIRTIREKVDSRAKQNSE